MDKDALVFPVSFEGGSFGEVQLCSSVFDALLILFDHHGHVIAPRKGVLYLYNMIWKAGSVKQMFQSRVLEGEIFLKSQ